MTKHNAINSNDLLAVAFGAAAALATFEGVIMLEATSFGAKPLDPQGALGKAQSSWDWLAKVPLTVPWQIEQVKRIGGI